MRILVLGSDGFIGRQVVGALTKDHDVYSAVRSKTRNKNKKVVFVDLLDKASILKALEAIRPEAIINCAGVVENSDKARLNVEFTSNLLTQVKASNLPIKKIIILGSAAEYGQVEKTSFPISEDAPLNAKEGYGLSKQKETRVALDYKNKYGLPIIIARIFNPIGPGMHDRFLIPGILRQIQEIKEGKMDTIEVSRLDSKRDYVNVKDTASAIKTILEKESHWPVYNIGSGHSTSNRELIDLILSDIGLDKKPQIVETSAQPEPPIAIQADISLIKSDLGWKPKCTIEESMKEIVNDTKRP